jgi:hypothetical protein
MSWPEENQSLLMAELARVRDLLERHVAGGEGGGAPSPGGSGGDGRGGQGVRSSLDVVCERFGLSPFERDILLLCAGVELDSGFAARCAAAQGDPARAYASFSLALAALPDAHWSALSPGRSLRYWRLIEMGSGSLTGSPLRIDERILHFLAGVDHPDERLTGLVRRLETPGDLVPSQDELARRAAAVLAEAAERGNLPAPTAAEQRALWQSVLDPEVAAGLDGRLDAVVSQFQLGAAWEHDLVLPAGRRAVRSCRSGCARSPSTCASRH